MGGGAVGQPEYSSMEEALKEMKKRAGGLSI